MADESIIFKIKAEADIDEATRQVAEMLKAAKELAGASGALSSSTKQVGQAMDSLGNASKKSADSLRENIAQENMLAGAADSMRKKLRETTQELQRLAEQGDTTSAEFLRLADSAAQMTDTMGDVSAVVNLLASDTKNLDTAMAVGGGLVGTFNAATSAMALLGGESEELQKAFLKVQAAMSLLNGVQQVAALLDKRSAANVVLRTALAKRQAAVTAELAASENLGTIAKVKATIAQKALNAAMAANPVGAILVGVTALVGAYMAISKALDDTKEKQAAFNLEMERTHNLMDQIKRDGDLAAQIAQAQGASDEEVLQLRITNAQKYFDEADRLQQEALQHLQTSSKKGREAAQQAYDQAKQDADAAWKDVVSLNDQMNVLVVANKHKAEEQATADAKKAAEERLKIAQDEFNARMQADKQAAEDEYQTAVNYAKYYEKKHKQEAEAAQAEIDRKKELARINQEIADEEAEYGDAELEKEEERFRKQQQMMQEHRDMVVNMATEIMQSVSSIAGDIFDLASSKVQQEMQQLEDALDQGMVTQEEYERKKAALQMKQARYAKANSLMNIGISTAMAIMQTLAQLGATPWGIAMASIAASTGAAQLAIAAAKPLAAYEKGRNGGEGEYALVGEKGAEIMYVPQGASIIPHNKINRPDTWGAYGVPQIATPDQPDIKREILTAIAMQSLAGGINYDKLGKAVAAAMPQPKAVSVNIDRNGIMVNNGHDIHTYMNTKYCGAWN